MTYRPGPNRPRSGRRGASNVTTPTRRSRRRPPSTASRPRPSSLASPAIVVAATHRPTASMTATPTSSSSTTHAFGPTPRRSARPSVARRRSPPFRPRSRRMLGAVDQPLHRPTGHHDPPGETQMRQLAPSHQLIRQRPRDPQHHGRLLHRHRQPLPNLRHDASFQRRERLPRRSVKRTWRRPVRPNTRAPSRWLV